MDLKNAAIATIRGYSIAVLLVVGILVIPFPFSLLLLSPLVASIVHLIMKF